MQNDKIITNNMRISVVREVNNYINDLQQIFFFFLLKQKVLFHNNINFDTLNNYNKWDVLIKSMSDIVDNIQDPTRRREKRDALQLLLGTKIEEVERRIQQEQRGNDTQSSSSSSSSSSST